MSRLTFRSAAELAGRVARQELSPVDVVSAHLDRIEERNDVTNAFVTIDRDGALEAAREAERAVERGDDLGPLHGVPVAIKDIFPTAGLRTTFGSVPFADFVPDEDAVNVARLREAGAIVIGKTNTPEFGHKGTTVNSLFGATGTPFDPDRTAGGSSGGSAAAVADGLVPIAQGSDGGGSIRIPASACGVFGMMPSFRRVPSVDRPNGITHTPFAGPGPITRTVEDTALLLEVMAGSHPGDPFSLPDDPAYRDATDRSIDDLSIAYSPDLGVFPVEERVRSAIDDAVDAFVEAGAAVTETSPSFGYSRTELLEAWRIGFQVRMATLAETMREHEGLDLLGEHREDLTPELVEHIEAGMACSAIEYRKADVLRTAVLDAMGDLFESYDLLVTPTLACLPFDIEEEIGPETIEGEPIDPMYGWFLTWPFNMTGHPAASVPAGTSEGLPIGMQVIGQRHDDATVLAASAAVEQVRPWHDAYPAR